MASKHRKLFQSVSNYTDCFIYCDQTCPYPCIPFPTINISYPPPPPPPPKHRIISPYVVALIIIGSFFLLVCCCTIFKKDPSNNLNNPTNSSPPQPDEEQHLDENLGRVNDNSICLITTAGLQPGLIKSITAYKYKSGEGIVEGTDCSVCLSEFQEDETLRILPKCSHVFHINCIDAWLSSHTNCPLCRAPIVSTDPISGSANQNTRNLSGNEEAQIRNNETDHNELNENRAQT